MALEYLKLYEPLPDLSVDPVNGGRTYALSDLHGSSPDVLYKAIEEKKLGRNDRLVLCGDELDRLPYSYELVKAIQENNKQRAASDGANLPEIIGVYGNHEAMFMCWYVEKMLSDEKIGAAEKTRYADIQEKLQIFFGEDRYALYAESYQLKEDDGQVYNGGDWAVAGKDTPEKAQQLKEVFEYFYCDDSVSLMARIDDSEHGDVRSRNFIHADLPKPMEEILSQREQQTLHLSESEMEKILETRTPLRPDGKGITICGHNPYIRYATRGQNGSQYYNLDVCTAGSGYALLLDCDNMIPELILVPKVIIPQENQLAWQGVLRNKQIFITPQQAQSFRDIMGSFTAQLNQLQQDAKKELDNIKDAELKAIAKKGLDEQAKAAEEGEVNSKYTAKMLAIADRCQQFQVAAGTYKGALGLNKTAGESSKPLVDSGTAQRALDTFIGEHKKFIRGIDDNIRDLDMPSTKKALRVLSGTFLAAASFGIVLLSGQFREYFFSPQTQAIKFFKGHEATIGAKVKALEQQTLNPPRTSF